MTVNKQDEDLFPYEIKSVDSELRSQILENRPGTNSGFVQVGPQKWFFPAKYEQEAKTFYNFKFRRDDVVVITFPRSGTTMTQEMTWLICNDLNYQKASEQILNERFPFLEFNSIYRGYRLDSPLKNDTFNAVPTWKELADMKNKRFIKTHLPFALLPPDLTQIGCKIIYVARNPKDVAVSYYHLHRSIPLHSYKGDFQKFWNLFEKGLATWCPYWEHVKEGWNKRNEENVLFLFYEDLIKDLKGAIEKVAVFLEKTYTTQEIEALASHLQIDKFRKNKSVNIERSLVENEEGFIRQGKTGGWKDYFDKELEKRTDEWIEKNLRYIDLRFPV